MKKMKKLLGILLSLVLLISFTACAMKAADEATELAGQQETKAMSKNSGNSYAGKGEDGHQSEAPNALADTSVELESSRSTYNVLAQRKVIRNANLTVEVDDFYEAYGHIQSMINGIGFVQETSINKDDYYYEGEKRYIYRGYVTIRIASERFDSILLGINELGDTVGQNISSQDITDQFFDTEGRLKVLKIELDYYETLLMKADDADEIFKIHTKLTQVRTEIERLEGTLNKWKDLVSLSTIVINLREKMPDSVNDSKPQTYWDRLLESLKDSLRGVFEALGDLVIFIIEAIPTLVILGIIALVAYKIYRRTRKKQQQVKIKDEE